MSGQYPTRGKDTPPGVLGKIPPHNEQLPIPWRAASTVPKHVHGADNIVSGSTYEAPICGDALVRRCVAERHRGAQEITADDFKT